MTHKLKTMKLLAIVQILLVVGVLTSIVTANLTLLILTILCGIVVGCIWWYKNKRPKAPASSKLTRKLPQKVQPKAKRPAKRPKKIQTITDKKKDTKEGETGAAGEAIAAPENPEIAEEPNERVLYAAMSQFEPLSVQVGREIASRNLTTNLPEPPDAQYESILHALNIPNKPSLHQNAIGYRTPIYMKNIKPKKPKSLFM